MESTVNKKKSREEAYELIKDRILTLNIKPGEAVTEQNLSTQLGIGRTPVREALTRLELDGLIVSQNGRKKVYILTIEEMQDIFDIKIVLEGAVTRWAAENGSVQQRKNLKRFINEMKQLSQDRPESEAQREKYLAQWLELDRQLHATIFAMADNRRAEQFIQKLNVQWHRLRIAAYALEGRIVKSVSEHEGFVLPIINQQPQEAEQAMRQHLQNLKHELINTMQLFHYPQD